MYTVCTHLLITPLQPSLPDRDHLMQQNSSPTIIMQTTDSADLNPPPLLQSGLEIFDNFQPVTRDRRIELTGDKIVLRRNKKLINILTQVGVKYGGEDVPGSPFEMSSNADTSDVIGDSSGIVFIIRINCLLLSL